MLTLQHGVLDAEDLIHDDLDGLRARRACQFCGLAPCVCDERPYVDECEFPEEDNPHETCASCGACYECEECDCDGDDDYLD